jgi:hypothetical protein
MCLLKLVAGAAVTSGSKSRVDLARLAAQLKEAAEKVDFAASAPKGASDFGTHGIAKAIP